jgi:hypothetical protein
MHFINENLFFIYFAYKNSCNSNFNQRYFFLKNTILKPQIKLFFSNLSNQTTTTKVTAKPNPH